MKYTIILLLQNGKLHIAECDNPQYYITTRNKKRGFWSCNRGKVKLLKIYYGEWKNIIAQVGIKHFLDVQNKEADLEKFVLDFIV